MKHTIMDNVKQECYRNTLRRTGPSFRFANRQLNEDRNLGWCENHYSSGGNNEIRSKRPIGRQSQPGSGDTTRPLHHPQTWWRGMPSRVLIIYGLEKMNVNCDKIFNLFCIYGNVTGVKVLNGKQALVELQDVEAAKRCVSNLNLLRLDETTKLKVKYSKHSYINDHGTLRALSDGTPTKKIYVKSKFNRFIEKEMNYANPRRTAAPSKILHFYNAPLDICARKMHKVVTDALGSMDAIRSITILPKKRPGAKCSTGLIEMKSNELALKTILLLNHMPFESSKSRFPFLMKLSFSKWSNIRQQSTDSSKLLLSVTSCTPLSLHNSEYASPTVEFAVARTTLQTTSSGETSWTLWEIRDVVTEAIDHVTGDLVRPTETFRDQLRVTRCDNPHCSAAHGRQDTNT